MIIIIKQGRAPYSFREGMIRNQQQLFHLPTITSICVWLLVMSAYGIYTLRVCNFNPKQLT